MSFTKLLAGIALLVTTTSPSFANDTTYSDNRTPSCVASGNTNFEQLLSVQECELERQQTQMARWNTQADARKQSIEDLNKQIQSAPEEQKAELQNELTELQNNYNDQYTSLQEANREQAAKVQNLLAQYNQLPPAEQRLVQLHMNKEMVQEKITALQSFNKSDTTAETDNAAIEAAQPATVTSEVPAAPTSETTETDAAAVQPEVQTIPAPLEEAKPNDTLWGSIKALFFK